MDKVKLIYLKSHIWLLNISSFYSLYSLYSSAGEDVIMYFLHVL